MTVESRNWAELLESHFLPLPPFCLQTPPPIRWGGLTMPFSAFEVGTRHRSESIYNIENRQRVTTHSHAIIACSCPIKTQQRNTLRPVLVGVCNLRVDEVSNLP